MRCTSGTHPTGSVHVELFAHEHVVVVPAGIGLAPPLRMRGSRVSAARCGYPLRTLDPTGLVLLSPTDRMYRLGEFFELWGQMLNSSQMVGFQAPRNDRVRVYLDGKVWRGDPRDAPLRPGAQITIELGGYVPPHPSYSFPPLSWATP